MKKSLTLIVMTAILAVLVSACHHRHRHRVAGPDMKPGVLTGAATMSVK